MKRDDFLNGTTRKNWWRYDLEGSANPAAMSNGTLSLSMPESDATEPWCNTSIWDGHNMYQSITLTMRVKAITPVRPGSRGWGLWYTNALSRPTEQAWFMQVGDDPFYPDYNPADVWWRSSVANQYLAPDPVWLEEVEMTANILQWHTYKIVRDVDALNEFVLYVDGIETHRSAPNLTISSNLSVQTWNDNLVYKRDPYRFVNREWSGGTPDQFVIDYIEILTEVNSDTGVTPSGTWLLRKMPSEMGSGASNYLWKNNYSFTGPNGKCTIIVTARAEQYGSYGDEDRLRINVSGNDYGWNNSKSFLGSLLDGSSKTVVIDTVLTSGSQSINIYGDQSPLLFDVTVLGSTDGDILLTESVEETASGGTDVLWKTYNFSCDPGEVSIYVSGTADEDITPSSYGRYLTNFNDTKDDDIRIVLDENNYGWQNENAIWGNRLFGETKSVLLRENLSGGDHTLQIYSNNTPTLHHVLVYGEHGDYSLPVGLTSFNLSQYNGRVKISWITESEIGNLGFNIYKAESSKDQKPLAGDFTQINDTIISGAGTSVNENNYEFYDENIETNKIYWYKLEDVSYSGRKKEHEPVSIVINDIIAENSILFPNYPNPFNSTTTISFSLNNDQNIMVDIYNLNGKLIRTLFQGEKKAGFSKFHWNGSDTNSSQVSSGVYFYRLITKGQVITKKMLVLR